MLKYKSSNVLLASALVAASSLSLYFAYQYYQKKPVLKEENETKVIIFYGSCTGTSKQFALLLQQYCLLHAKLHCTELLNHTTLNIIVKDMEDFDDSDLESTKHVIILTSTWTDGQPPIKAKRLHDWLQDYATDFRVSKDHLKQLSFSMFGLGGKVYKKNYCKTASLEFLISCA